MSLLDDTEESGAESSTDSKEQSQERSSLAVIGDANYFTRVSYALTSKIEQGFPLSAGRRTGGRKRIRLHHRLKRCW